MIKVLGLVFRFYRAVVSPALTVGFDVRCRHEESCSRYFERSLRERGLARGSAAGIRRLLSCNMWSAS